MTASKLQWAATVALLSWGLTIILLLLALLSEMAYQDELAGYEHTCDMIEAGAWPAEVEPSCGEREP